MKRLLFILIALIQCVNVWGQDDLTLTKCEAYLPSVLLDNTVLKESVVNEFLKDSSYGQAGKAPSAKKYWVVYSDRADNKTYRNSNGTAAYKTVGWNEELRIARISGKYALVYSEPNAKVKWPNISKDAIAMGWIPMDNLLLWDTCLADDKGIFYKALVCRNVDAGNDTSSGKVGKRYLHPTLQSRSLDMDAGVRFYFIMKRDKGGKVLLATQDNVNGVSSKVLYGWLSPNAYIAWNQRSCIEPTWDIEDVEYLASKRAEAQIYDDEGDLASSWQFAEKAGDDDDKYRMAPGMLRFPILDGTTETKYECSSFGAQDIAVDERRLEILKKKQNIKLIIVIDGTRSMGKYFSSVYEAIQKGCEFFDEDKFSLQVGVVIYRDYPDGQKGLVEIFPFSRPNDTNLYNFLQKGGEYGIGSAKADLTHTEALFYGINEAIDKLKLDPSESNVMLVVGDCGNAENDPKAPTQKEIEEKIIKYEINLLSFQVRNRDAEAWDIFNTQMRTINMNTLQAKYDAISDEETKIISARRGNGFEFRNSARQDPSLIGEELFFGINRYATVGLDIDPEVLTELIRESLKTYAKVVQNQINLIVNPSYIPVSAEIKSSVGFRQNQNWLKKHGLETSTELLAFRGTTAKTYNEVVEYYKPVLFITDRELSELLRRLEPVYQVANKANSDDRKPYIDAIKALLRGFVPDLTDDDMYKMGMSAITNMIQGLNVSSAAMNGEYTLNDIAEKISKPTYRDLVNSFANKYRALKSLYDGDYKYKKEFNNAIYYWIPIEDLP